MVLLVVAYTDITSNAWSQPDATEFYVRGANYMNDKVKVLSKQGAYNLLGVDLLLTDTKVRKDE